jgi:hypothetical protein
MPGGRLKIMVGWVEKVGEMRGIWEGSMLLRGGTGGATFVS